jgi:hypothetical protein
LPSFTVTKINVDQLAGLCNFLKREDHDHSEFSKT